MAAKPQEIIDAIDDAILAKLQGGADRSYEISGRSLTNMSMKALRDFQKECVALLNASNGERTNYTLFNER